MKPWRFFRENIAKWTARTMLGLVVLTLLLEVAHSIGFLKMLNISEASTTELLLLSSVALGSLLIEEFSRTEKNVEELKLQQEASLHVSRFDTSFAFHSRWKHMRETFDTFTVSGVVGQGFLIEFQKLKQKTGVRCDFYLSMDSNSEQVACNYLSLIAPVTKPSRNSKPTDDNFRLFDAPASEGSAWVIARKWNGSATEVLICHTALEDEAFAGLHLNGEAAVEFARCVLPRLEQRTTARETNGPVRIYTQRQIRDAVRVKHRYSEDLHAEIEKGTLLNGVDEVCQVMKRELQMSQRFLDVTHICTEQTIPLLREEIFVDWLAANYAARERKIKITRIFIIPRVLRKDPLLIAVIQEMKSHGIDILICDMEKLEERYQEDFSIYDEKHVIYISHEGGGSWLNVASTRARCSDDLDKVKSFRQIFEYVRTRCE